jgi:hypothetical protein
VVLLDRRGAAEETSFGNAGLIQREGVYPYGFPHDFGALIRYGFNRTIDAYYHPSALPRLAPFLAQYWRYSRPARHAEVARRYSKLIEHCVTEHQALAEEAGRDAFLHRTGWLKVFRTERERDLRSTRPARWKREFGIDYRALDARTLRELEPHVAPVLVGALPLDRAGERRRSARARARLPRRFERLGGRFVQGNAASLEPDARRRLAPAQRAGRRFAREGGRRARSLGRRADACAGLRASARGEARLPHALPGGGTAKLNYPDARHRARLLPRADAPRHPPHHGRGVRAARRDPHPGAARARRADRARSLPARRAARHRAVDGARGPARPTCCR